MLCWCILLTRSLVHHNTSSACSCASVSISFVNTTACGSQEAPRARSKPVKVKMGMARIIRNLDLNMRLSTGLQQHHQSAQSLRHLAECTCRADHNDDAAAGDVSHVTLAACCLGSACTPCLLHLRSSYSDSKALRPLHIW